MVRLPFRCMSWTLSSPSLLTKIFSRLFHIGQTPSASNHGTFHCKYIIVTNIDLISWNKVNSIKATLFYLLNIDLNGVTSQDWTKDARNTDGVLMWVLVHIATFCYISRFGSLRFCRCQKWVCRWVGGMRQMERERGRGKEARERLEKEDRSDLRHQRYRLGLKMGPNVHCHILLCKPMPDLDSWDWVLSKSDLTCSNLTTGSWETAK